MQVLPIVFGLLFVIGRPSADAIILSNFQQQALAQHNYYRQQLHCTTAMTLNSSLNTIAQNYAQYLAANNIFNHSGAVGLGENLWMESSSVVISFVNGSEPTVAWYNEIYAYNYSSPGFASATGHFTQVVWSDSVQLGIGIAFTSNNRSAYAVANYYPPGNYIGQFASKVPPLCISTTTNGTTANAGVTIAVETTADTGATSSTRAPTTAGTTISAGITTTAGTTMDIQRLNNSATSTFRQRTHLSANVVVLGSLFRLFLL